jgi:hypothetical protein
MGGLQQQETACPVAALGWKGKTKTITKNTAIFGDLLCNCTFSLTIRMMNMSLNMGLMEHFRTNPSGSTYHRLCIISCLGCGCVCVCKTSNTFILLYILHKL